jgi:ornithine cyclodeaminase
LAAVPAAVAAEANLIVTATAANAAYLMAADVRPGTHITAIGSDTPEKTELEPRLLASADVVVADSTAQCLLRGEIRHAVEARLLDPARVVELGAIIKEPARGRRDDRQITIADLTGVAFQDIQISKAICARLDPAEAAA